MKTKTSDKVQEYGLCILFHLVLPLLPIFLEKWISGAISSKSLLLCTAIYAVAIGNNSRYKLIFGISIIISFIFAVSFGVVAAGKASLSYSEESAMLTLSLLFISSLIEKYGVHIVDGRTFWNH